MYAWSDSDIAIRDAVREWIDAEVRPQLDELETGAIPPYDLARKLFKDFGLDAMGAEMVGKWLASERRRAERKAAAAAVEAAGEPVAPREKKPKSDEADSLGGFLSMGAVMGAELCGVSLGSLVSMGVSIGLGASTIATKGTLEQKERWLPKIVTAEHVAAWAITEPDSGSDAFGGMKTTARRDGDGFILKGQKTFITNGPYADVMVVYAKLDEGDGTPIRDRKVVAFVLERGMPGLTQGKPFKKMGIMSSPTGELFFDDVRLTMDHLLGGEKALTASKSNDGRDSARQSFVL
jgi:alkylation response protein AidB-like acyl-CoA dehydrogenase